jgi:hypothetical protein
MSPAKYLCTKGGSPHLCARQAEEAYQHGRNGSRHHEHSRGGTLAAAYANNGQFEEAISWQEKALVREKGRKEKAELRAALELFRAGQPFRAPQRSG